MYAATSTTHSNGSAFGGLSGNTPFYNLGMCVTMFVGRYLPMVFVLALAGRLAEQKPVAVTTGTLRASGLNFLPALSPGPLADGMH